MDEGHAHPEGRRRAAVVVNPTRADDVASLHRTVTAAMSAAGWAKPLWLETTTADHGRGVTERALREGVSLVLVHGGDGTVRATLPSLAGSGIPLGLLPAGAGNLLARALGIPVGDPRAALAIALTGADRAIDVARVEGAGGERFAVIAGVGFDAAMIRDAPEPLKARLGWLAYLASAVRNLGRSAVDVEVRIDDDAPIRARARTVVIANVSMLPSGARMLPNAVPDDGLLDVAVIDGHRVMGWLRVAARVVARRGRVDRTTGRGRRVRIRTASPQPRELDGDLIGEGRELAVEVEPGAVLVRVPAVRDARHGGGGGDGHAPRQ